MIDKTEFLAGMTALSGAFGREIDGAVQRMYYGILNPKLTTDEFQRAVKETLETETFWPAPAVLLGKIERLREDLGLLAFQHVNRVTANYGGFRYLPHEVYQREFDAPTRAAIASVGGLPKIANTPEDRWPALERRFTAAYQDAASGKPMIEREDVKMIAAGEREDV